MNLIENKDAVLEQVNNHRDHLAKFPFMEMELTIKQISPECLKQLARHYNPNIDSDEVINEPSDISPYTRFSEKINNQLRVEFRGPKLHKTTIFKEIL